ncbi:MAG TPA: hypothetical protein VLF68_04440 [Candidatus Saccharimonadales bacterium]|nr:hypothetical protein [Candidatus Saccharimonadales bacterium]
MKYHATKLLLAFFVLLLGNSFWLLFARSLTSDHLLTNSLPAILLSVLYPVIVFGLYLTAVLFFSLMAKQKILWLLLIVCSFVSYPFILSKSWQSIVGELVISCCIFAFLIGFHRFHVLLHNKTAFLPQVSLSLMGPTVVISIVIAINFYSFYARTLTSGNIIISNQVFLHGLSPILRIYLDDLHVTNIDETYGNYLKRRAFETRTTTAQVDTKTEGMLLIGNINQNAKIRTVIEKSLNESIIKIFAQYRRLIPVVVSLGLGIITQTLITFSTFITYGSFYILYNLFLRLKLLRLSQKSVSVESLFPVEHKA